MTELVQFRGVQNPHRGGANAPPSLFLKAFSRAASEEYLLNDRQGVQGGSSLFCIKICGKGELLITIMSSMAQEESRSISENVTWGHRKRFADGKVCVLYRHFLGYDKGPDGKDGYTFRSIARELTARGLVREGQGTVRRSDGGHCPAVSQGREAGGVHQDT